MGEIGVKMRKSLSFVIRESFGSVCSHPFLVGFVCFLICLYRSSPFLFSLLVSASPVFICTALVLGTLLSFGQVNLPEIEIEDKSLRDVAAPLKTELSGDSTRVHENESDYVKRYSEESKEKEEQSGDDESRYSDVRGGSGEDEYDTGSYVEERSREKELGIGEVWGDGRELGDTRYKEKAEWYDGRLSDVEIVENHYSSIHPETNDECFESDDERSEGGSFDSERVNVASLDSPPRSPWKRIEDRDEEDMDEDVEEDEGSDSESDRAESSSPDASMADIMPMLDELHPLLDEDAPQPTPMSMDGSDAESERTSRSSSHDSDEDTEHDVESEVGEDENEDGEDEQGAEGDKEEQTTSAITWTEEDQKNLMDLGTSELERNQRLENLILRRRARKNMSMVPERNLIDLESTDFPNIAPISTIRHNPFDVSHDSYDNSGLPPIPGSAPSVLLPRRNPFDIPYDSSEEKPNLVGDGLQEDFTTFQPREPFQPRDQFQPREPFFRRHESFNVGPSIFAPGRQERLDVRFRPFFVPERMVSDESSYSLFQRQSSELSDSKVSSIPETESLGSVEDLEERKLPDEDNEPELESLPSMKDVIVESPLAEHGMSSNREEEVTEEDELQETVLISDIAHVSENVGHGSQSSEDEESLRGEVQATGYHSNSEDVERRYSRDSSSSSLSEVSERVFTNTEVLRRDANVEASSISTQTSVGSTELRITSTVADEVPHREPVYDISPPALRKNFSSSSISSIVHVDSALDLPPVLVKRMVPSVQTESEMNSPEDFANIQMLPSSSSSHQPMDEHESRIINVVDKSEQSNTKSDVLESIIEASVGENLINQQIHGNVPSLSSDEDIHDVVESSEDQHLSQSMEDKHSVISGIDNLGEVSGQASTSQLPINQSDEENTMDNVQSPNSDCDVFLEAHEKLSLTPTTADVHTGTFFYDKAMHQTSFKHLNVVQAPNSMVESSSNLRTIQEVNMPEVQELDQDMLTNTNSPLSPDFISIPSTSSGAASPHAELQTVVEEVDEIKEIDEGILSELDTVCDFSTKQWGSGSEESEKRMVDSVGESSSLTHHVGTSAVTVEVNSVEVTTTEHMIESTNLREEMDVYEDMENISEIQTSERCSAEHIDISGKEYNGQDSLDQGTSDDDTSSTENEASPIYPAINDIHEAGNFGIPETEGGMHNAETGASGAGSSELLNRGEVEDSGLQSGPILPELVIKETVEEHEKSTDLEPVQVERVIRETVIEHDKSDLLEATQVALAIEESIVEHSEGQMEHGTIAVNSNQETSVLEVCSVGETSLDKQVVETREIHETSTDLLVPESNPSEGASMRVEEVLSDTTVNQLEASSIVESVKVEADKVESSMPESNVKEISVDHEVQEHKDSRSSKTSKGKGKASKSKSSGSSSSSSSSSDSSSSDSDKE